MSKNCYVETALEMSGYSKMLDIWTDLYLFSETAGSVQTRLEWWYHFKGTLWILFNFQTKYPDRDVYRHFGSYVVSERFMLTSDLVYRRYQYTGWDKEIILFREIYSALSATIKQRMSRMFFFRIKHMGISEKMCRGLTGHTRQLLLMFLTLCQLMTRWLFRIFCLFLLYKVLQRRNSIATLQTDT